MKTWLFAAVQSVIGLLGLLAWFVAENAWLTGAAAIAAAATAIVQPWLSAHKSRKLDRYRQAQHQKAISAVDDQVHDLLSDVIAPPLPHRATVKVLLQTSDTTSADSLMQDYDLVTQRLSEPDAAECVADLAGRLPSGALGDYLLGLNALAAQQWETARVCFKSAVRQRPGWIAPWLGWAAACWVAERFDEIREEHPHIRGVELLPWDIGNDATFIALDESDREELTDAFQRAATSLGNYYAAAEFRHSRTQIETAHEELKRAA